MKKICALAAVLLCGCWETGFSWSVSGTARDARSGAAVSGALAVIRCAGVAGAGYDSSDLEAQDSNSLTDSAGRFGLSSLGDGPHLGCELQLSAAGYQNWSGALSQACQTQASGRCQKAQVEVALSH